MRFADRTVAGKLLAKELVAYKDKPNTIVLALPRGGVPVAFEIAKALNLPLDIMLVRKLGVPGYEELAMGAIADGGVQILNKDIIRSLGVPSFVIEQVIDTERRELKQRSQAYREGRPEPNLKGRTVILVDDGMATGANMRAAVDATKHQQVAYIIVAVPVASDSAYDRMKEVANEIICLEISIYFSSVGASYKDFSQTSDREVKMLLEKIAQESAPKAAYDYHHT